MSATIGRVLLMPKGTYSGSTVYNSLDWVRYNGVAWVCKVDGTVGVVPTEGANWTLMAQDGSVSGAVDWGNVGNKPFDDLDSDDFDTDANNDLVIKRNTFGVVRVKDGQTTTDLEASGDSIVQIEAGNNVTISADDTANPKKLVINSTGGGGGASSLNDLSDVTITTPANDQVLKYDGSSSKWVNGSADASPTQNSTNVVQSGGVYTALSGKANTSALDEWTTGVQTLDGTTFVFDNLSDSYGYDLYGDDKLYGTSSLSKTTGTNPGTIKLTYTVSGASIGDYGYLRILK